MKNTFLLLFSLMCGIVAQAQPSIEVRNLQRAMELLDATMHRSFRGTEDNLFMADVCDAETDAVSGPSDVWPYTAAIEAHCSVLEALESLKDIAPDVYYEHHDRYLHQLDVLINNLSYYRGTYTLTSYATRRTWSVYAVPRASQPNKGNVTGDNLKFNVYDDQMWIARELIRAYRLTGKAEYLSDAVHLTDYVLDGWDCWNDDNGEEYGGITWGPGYNSKHACSNGPIIQPLVWLSNLYRETSPQATVTYYYREPDNTLASRAMLRSELYLDFAKKIYAWQKKHLLNSSTGVYWDMLGADNILQYTGTGAQRRRAHVDNGNPTGNAYTYNTGTMLAGATELYLVTGDDEYKNDIPSLAVRSYNAFTKPKNIDGIVYRQWPTDNSALQGFNVWFDNVLMRAYVDADPTGLSAYSSHSLETFQTNLDYAYDHYQKNGFLPIDLLGGWNGSTKTKGFHQASFAAEYAMLAIWQHRISASARIQSSTTIKAQPTTHCYTLTGIPIDREHRSLPFGIYLTGGQKHIVTPTR